MLCVYRLGGGDERVGFKWFALIIAILFVLFTTITCVNVKEKSTVNVDSPSVGQMFRALIQNDQAMTVVITIVLINCAVYTTSNLVIYFFKYDLGGAGWRGDYTIFNTFGGGVQILAMMLIFPLLRKFFNTMKIFYVCIASAVGGYVVLLVMTLSGVSSVYPFLLPGFFIFAAAGILNVLVTIFLANTVDYGELKNKRRDESVIFSMQTFVVKLASGIAGFLSSMVLFVFNINSDKNAEAVAISETSSLGLRLSMTLIPIVVLLVGFVVFRKKYILSDDRMDEITAELAKRKND